MAELECQEHIQRTHNACCKIVIRHATIDMALQLRKRWGGIVVHECNYDENDARRQDIEIYYSFVGKIDLSEA